MYQRLFLNRTKKKYREIMDIAIKETKILVEQSPGIPMYKVIYDQLIDIKTRIIEERQVFSKDEIFKHYNLGAIAAKNFDLETEEYAQRLSDIFGGSIDYHSMPEDSDSGEGGTTQKPSGGWSVL